MSGFLDRLRRLSAVIDRYWLVSFGALGVAMEFVEHDVFGIPWHRTISSIVLFSVGTIASAIGRKRRRRYRSA